MQTDNTLKESSFSEILDIVLGGGEQGDEAMYFLLHERLAAQLRSRYEPFRHKLYDGFDDVIEDFFLYLRDGDGHPGSYHSLRTIRNREAFEVWLLNTFRNYLSTRADKEGRVAFTALAARAAVEEESPMLTDERKLAIASHLIAGAHQTFVPRDRFLLLRMLLTMLNRERAMPNDEVARAIGMSEVSYRVAIHRIRRRLSRIRSALLRGGEFPLDSTHSEMARQINDNFVGLYSTLYGYYVASVDALSDAEAVIKLRQGYMDDTGLALHEPESPYSLAPSVSAFWTMMSRL